MSEAYVVAVEGLSAFRTLDTLPKRIVVAARQAVNRTTERARTISARQMQEQVNFRARYLSGANGRLSITKKATDADLTGVITGRHRPTSLAHFATAGVVGKAGVSVQVAPGFARRMNRAFLIKLRAGANVDTKSNSGVAIRLQPGETIENKRRMVQVSGNLYLLYGPSVDQVFRNVAADVAPEAGDLLEAEFLRLLDVGGSA